VFNPELLYWSFPATAISFVVQLVGLTIALSATMGVEFGRKLPVSERAFRVLLFLAVAFWPGLLPKVAAIAVFAALFHVRTRSLLVVPGRA